VLHADCNAYKEVGMTTTATSVRDVLLEIVNELQDLRANQLMLAARGGADAQDIAARQFQDIYDKLRRQVEQLPL
jgi:hypothetical protein